jgi:hypothetical protein
MLGRLSFANLSCELVRNILAVTVILGFTGGHLGLKS